MGGIDAFGLASIGEAQLSNREEQRRIIKSARAELRTKLGRQLVELQTSIGPANIDHIVAIFQQLINPSASDAHRLGLVSDAKNWSFYA